MQMFSQSLKMLAESVVDAARDKKMRIVTAESCTGGLIGACLTEISGASDVFDQGFITYSNDSKITHLGVLRKTLLDCG
ncbi:MAG: CinA family protein, partial [Alphaproteobacteria bacterium]|nr:CinA family protein [Alphaproteobacteria bacterium]